MRICLLFAAVLLCFVSLAKAGNSGESSAGYSAGGEPSSSAGEHYESQKEERKPKSSLKGSNSDKKGGKGKNKGKAKSKDPSSKVIETKDPPKANHARALEDDGEEVSYEHHPDSKEDKLYRASKNGQLEQVRGPNTVDDTHLLKCNVITHCSVCFGFFFFHDFRSSHCLKLELM